MRWEREAQSSPTLRDKPRPNLPYLTSPLTCYNHPITDPEDAMTRSIRPTLAAIALLVTPLAACEDGQVKLGRQIAETYCQDCHAIGKTGKSRFAPAPRFRDLHTRYDVSLLSEALVEGLVTAHPEMPEFEFDPDQAEAIIAYLKTLEPTGN